MLQCLHAAAMGKFGEHWKWQPSLWCRLWGTWWSSRALPRQYRSRGRKEPPCCNAGSGKPHRYQARWW